MKYYCTNFLSLCAYKDIDVDGLSICRALLKGLQAHTDRPMKNYKSCGNVFELEQRFIKEIEEEENQ